MSCVNDGGCFPTLEGWTLIVDFPISFRFNQTHVYRVYHLGRYTSCLAVSKIDPFPVCQDLLG